METTQVKVLFISATSTLLAGTGLFTAGMSTTHWAYVGSVSERTSRYRFGVWRYCEEFLDQTSHLTEDCFDMVDKPFNDSTITSSASQQASALTSAGAAALFVALFLLLVGTLTERSQFNKISIWFNIAGTILGIVGGLIFDLLLRYNIGDEFNTDFSTFLFFGGCFLALISLILQIVQLCVSKYKPRPDKMSLHTLGYSYHSFGASERSVSYTSFT